MLGGEHTSYNRVGTRFGLRGVSHICDTRQGDESPAHESWSWMEFCHGPENTLGGGGGDFDVRSKERLRSERWGLAREVVVTL